VSEANARHELLRALRAARDGDFSIRLPDGRAGVEGEIAGAFNDLVAQQAELRRESDERYRIFADAMPQIVWTAGPDGVADYVNDGWVSYSGLTLEQTANDGWLAVLHPDDLAHTTTLWEHALASGRFFETEYRLRRADGVYRWQLARSRPGRGTGGELTGWVGTCTDIDDRKRAEDAQALLVDASAVLGSSLDYHSTLGQVAELAVPRIADWCGVDVVEDDGELRRLAVVHTDPSKVKFALELQERYPPDPSSERGVQPSSAAPSPS
jgi:PAS domain S-box-containing protein